mgnify:CR=1 FL=1
MKYSKDQFNCPVEATLFNASVSRLVFENGVFPLASDVQL